MRKAIMLLLCVSTFAKDKPKTLTAVFTGPSFTMRYNPDPYYVGEYTCDRGYDDRAPDCYKDPTIQTDVARVVIRLEGGSIYREEQQCTGQIYDAACNIFYDLMGKANQTGVNTVSGTYAYKLGKQTQVPAHGIFKAYVTQEIVVKGLSSWGNRTTYNPSQK